MARHIGKVGKVRIKRSAFNLNYRRLFNTDMGILYPVQCDFVMPSDVWQMTHDLVIRLQPLVAPVLHEINAFLHSFFVPIRIIDDDFEEQLTGGEQGPTLPENVEFTKWVPTALELRTKHNLWDALIGANRQIWPGDGLSDGPTIAEPYPVIWPKRAYNLIYNEYYRDQNLQTEIDLDQGTLLKRAWAKDRFTSALPTPQRGQPMALPITGTTFADFTNNTRISGSLSSPVATPSTVNFISLGMPAPAPNGYILADNYANGSYQASALKNALNQNVVDLSVASTFDVNDLRTVVQMQKWMERNMRAGVRYTEFLQARWNVSPRDDRLQRPEYIGGSKSPIIISEVLQTSQTDESPQGTMAGHGLSANISSLKSYKVQEFGIIITLLSIMPKAMYSQGIDKQWLINTRYDIPFPEFTHLGEQAVLTQEIYQHNNESIANRIFGFRGIFDEHRSKQDRASGDMVELFDYWHLGRKFDSAPNLNASFIMMDGTSPVYRRIFASQDEPGFIVSVGNRIRGIRPLPVVAEPGMMDHF